MESPDGIMLGSRTAEQHPNLESAPESVAVVERGRILIVDDQELIRRFCRAALEPLALSCDEAADGAEALAKFKSADFDIVLLDIDMPGRSGWEVCRQLRQMSRQPHVKILLFSGNANPDDLARMLLAGADDYLTKPSTPVRLASRVQAAWQLKCSQDRSDQLHREVLALNQLLEQDLRVRDSHLVEARNALFLALAKLAESRDNDTGAHLWRLQAASKTLAAEAMRTGAFRQLLDENYVAMVAACAPLHDIGKVGLPDCILRKPGPLTLDERRQMETHTVIGAETLQEVARRHNFALAFLQMSIDIARHHHERYDGAGYPDRLQGASIPLAARIVAICDVYDALRSPRIYKPAWSHEQAVAYIHSGGGIQFDPDLVECFVRHGDAFARVFAQYHD